MAVDFGDYAKLAYWTPEEAVAILHGKEEYELSVSDAGNWREHQSYEKTLKLTLRAIEAKQLPVHLTPGGYTVTPVDFLAWARKIGLYIPPDLLAHVNLPSQIDSEQEFKRLRRELEIKDQKISDLSKRNEQRWPWGPHETVLLKRLADAATRYWKNYDPSDPTTAPTNKEVSDWLQSQNVANRVAEVMAQILRADGLRPGPRK
jgi:hypothetical protein